MLYSPCLAKVLNSSAANWGSLSVISCSERPCAENILWSWWIVACAVEDICSMNLRPLTLQLCQNQPHVTSERPGIVCVSAATISLNKPLSVAGSHTSMHNFIHAWTVCLISWLINGHHTWSWVSDFMHVIPGCYSCENSNTDDWNFFVITTFNPGGKQQLNVVKSKRFYKTV